MKEYKGYELMKMIANEELVKGTKFKQGISDTIYTFNGFNLKNDNGEAFLQLFSDKDFAKGTFTLIEENPNIDIQSIEELDTNKTFDFNRQGVLEWGNEMEDKINELVQAIKQLDRQINNT